MKMMTYGKNIILYGIKSVQILKKKLDSKPVYNKAFLKIKIKPYGDEATTIHDNEMPGFNLTCLAVITIGSAFKKDKNYYPQVFLKECKFGIPRYFC